MLFRNEDKINFQYNEIQDENVALDHSSYSVPPDVYINETKVVLDSRLLSKSKVHEILVCGT